MKQRCRIGYRHGLWYLPSNATIAVVYIDDDRVPAVAAAMELLRSRLVEAGHQQVADRLVFEAS